ncbi:hypothetical protein EF849_21980 [Aeromonas jandaei]|nr:hypothetical protein [Aeromonas jandaei]
MVTVLALKPHHSLGLLVPSVARFIYSGWLLALWKGITRDIRKGVKCVPKMVRFWNPHLLARWSLGRFIKDAILGDRLGMLTWGDLGELRDSGWLLTRIHSTKLTNLAKDTSALPT